MMKRRHMINCDLHIHAEYCGHAKGMTIPAIIKEANDKKLSTIAITSHVFGTKNLPIIDKIRSEVNKIDSKCKIIVGAEVDVDRYTDGRLVTEDLDSADYIVAGQHFIPTVGNYASCPEDCTLSTETLMEYWESMIKGVAANPKVTTIAHPERLIAIATEFEQTFDFVMAVFESIAPLTVENNIAWELNETDSKKLTPAWKENLHLLYKPAIRAGAKFVFGSDAHAAGEIGKCDFVESILAKLPKIRLATPKELGIV